MLLIYLPANVNGLTHIYKFLSPNMAIRTARLQTSANLHYTQGVPETVGFILKLQCLAMIYLASYRRVSFVCDR